jgi:hypothetical protein
MIGGGKVGGPRDPHVIPGGAASTPAKDVAKPSTPTAPRTDSFESGQARSGGAAPHAGGVFGREQGGGASNLLQLARTNPTAARQLVASLAAQNAATSVEVERELAGARQMLAQLGAERFTKEAREKVAADLRRQREKIAQLKLRAQLTARKMALLQQIAGKLGDPRLDDEIDRILQQHKKLKTDWGRRYHLLTAGGAVFGADDETPEHLRNVVSTEVRAAGRSRELGEVMTELSPRRALSDMMARTIDGSVKPPTQVSAAAKRGELGKSMQNYTFVTELIDGSLKNDPFDPERHADHSDEYGADE